MTVMKTGRLNEAQIIGFLSKPKWVCRSRRSAGKGLPEATFYK